MTEGAIRVIVTEQRGRLSATATGSITTALTNVYSTLGLSESSVLRAIKRISGDDNYQQFHFARMTRTLTPIPGSAQVIDSQQEPLVRTTRTYRNRSSHAASYDGRLSTTETNTFAVSWSQSNNWEAAFEIGYEAIISGSARFAFGGTVGSSEEHSQSVTVSSDDGVSVNLQPGQEALATLSVNRRLDTLRIRYRVEYGGDVVASYSNTRRFSYDPPPPAPVTFDLHEILEECNRSTRDVVTETIRIKYFTDAEVVLSDL